MNSDNSKFFFGNSSTKLVGQTPTSEIFKTCDERNDQEKINNPIITDLSPIIVSNAPIYSKSLTISSNLLSSSVSPIRNKPNASKLKYDDPYVYSKIMKNQDTTPFQKLLSVAADSNTSTYPYFTRVSREIKKTESVFIKKILKTPIAYKECCCSLINHRLSNKE